MPPEAKQDLVKISGLAKAAGVSVSTIHYYVQEGLLTPPVKTSRNMAYYDPCTVQEIHLIQELRAKKFLPLAAIKLILLAKRKGQNMEHVLDMRSFMEEIFRPVADVTGAASLTLAELSAATGLPVENIKALEAKGMIKPSATPRGAVYDDIDVLIARAFNKLAGYGFKVDDLDFFRQAVELISMEVKAVHRFFHQTPDHDKIPLVEMYKTFMELNGYLTMRIIRREAEHLLEEKFPTGQKA